jgi:predicted nucleic-acid-binding protein
MIGIDTNVLVRFITQDDAVQSAKASRLVQSLSADTPGFVSMVTLAELAWVLERTFRYTYRSIADTFLTLLESDAFVFENEPLVVKAFAMLDEGRGSFADALIGQVAMSAGCARIVTFDVDACTLPGFELL